MVYFEAFPLFARTRMAVAFEKKAHFVMLPPEKAHQFVLPLPASLAEARARTISRASLIAYCH